MNTMRYPVPLKLKVDKGGDLYWEAEQKQLGIVVEEYGSLDDALDEMRYQIKDHFSQICSEDRFTRMDLVLVAAKAEMVVDISVNHTLSEFGGGSVETEDPDEELETDPDFEQLIMSGDDTATVDEATKGVCSGDGSGNCLECDLPDGEIPPCEADGPAWEPMSFEYVTIRDPVSSEECGVFQVEERFFQEGVLEGFIKIHSVRSPLIKEDRTELEIEKSRLVKGPEAPCAKFCKARNCEDYVPRGPGEKPSYECKLSSYTPSYNKVCPKDEAAILSQQTALIAAAREKGEA